MNSAELLTTPRSRSADAFRRTTRRATKTHQKNAPKYTRDSRKRSGANLWRLSLVGPNPANSLPCVRFMRENGGKCVFSGGRSDKNTGNRRTSRSRQCHPRRHIFMSCTDLPQKMPNARLSGFSPETREMGKPDTARRFSGSEGSAIIYSPFHLQ